MVRRLLVLSLIAIVLATAGDIRVNMPSVVTDEYNGQAIAMKQGSTVDVRLHEQVQCGYTWAVSLSDGLFLESDSSFPIFPEECMGIVPNPGGMHRFVIRAMKPGTQKMQCIYGTPEKPDIALSRFNLTIVVEGPMHKEINKSETNNGSEDETHYKE